MLVGGAKSNGKKAVIESYRVCLPIPLLVNFGFAYSDSGSNELQMDRI